MHIFHQELNESLHLATSNCHQNWPKCFDPKIFTIIGAFGIIQGDQGRSKGLKKYQAGIWQYGFCAIDAVGKIYSAKLSALWLPFSSDGWNIPVNWVDILQDLPQSILLIWSNIWAMFLVDISGIKLSDLMLLNERLMWFILPTQSLSKTGNKKTFNKGKVHRSILTSKTILDLFWVSFGILWHMR